MKKVFIILTTLVTAGCNMAHTNKTPPPPDIDSTTILHYADNTPADYGETMQRINDGIATLTLSHDKKSAVVRIQSDYAYQIDYPNIPENLKYLGISLGNANSDIVVLNTPGGPITSIEEVTEEGEEFLNNAGFDFDNLYFINLHQAQTLEKTKYENELITFDEAKQNAQKSTRILGDFIRYFKSQGKTVFVLGISYGAFVVADSLHTDGNMADKYFIMVGRLDMTPQVWQPFSQGNLVIFEDDGITPVKVASADELPTEDQNMFKMAAALGHKRYTQLLANTPMDNVTYLYATNDEAVGRLTDAEIAFLKSKNVTIIKTKDGHGSFEPYLNLQRFIDR